MNLFNGRKIVIATKHKKEMVIAPILKKQFNMDSFPSVNFDTDELGTFTGEIERKHSPVDTLREKCLKAMELNQCDLGIANEGSFGPHPQYYFVPSDEELIILIDKKNELEIIEKLISTQTNFNRKIIKNFDELKDFANLTLFPSHALILSSDNFIAKGIEDWENLYVTYNHCKNLNAQIIAETDMRAMYNPTRMAIIEQLTLKLVEKIKKLCPQCNAPGFSIGKIIDGLPCELCKLPTSGTLNHIYVCAKCKHEKIVMYPNAKMFQDAQFCNYCNP